METKKKSFPKNTKTYESDKSIWTKEIIDQIADLFIEFVEDPSTLYFKEFTSWLWKHHGLLLSERSYSRFCERSEKFKAHHDYAKTVQECKIVKGGLVKKLDSQMSKFMLCAVHGFSDKQTIEHQGQETIQVINYGSKELKTWEEQRDKIKNELSK